MAVEDVTIIERLATIEAKLDNALKIIPDHEHRIRGLEQKKEECLNEDRFCKIETRLDTNEDDIQILQTTHAQDDGKKQAGVNLREWVIIIIAILGWMVSLFQVFGGQ